MTEKQLRLSRRGNDALAAIGLILLVALRFVFVVWHHQLYGPFNDNVYFVGPMFAETARLALHGIFPYYLPSFGTGFPLFESPHYCVSYPFYFFGFLDYGGPLQALYTLTGLTIFHRFLFALNLYVMLRCASISPWAAFTGASIGVFARNTELYASWVTMTASYTWMPLLIGGAILLVRSAGSLWGILLLGSSAGLMTLATAAQPVSHAILFCVVFFTAFMVRLILRHEWSTLFRLVFSLVAAGAIALGLGAVSAVPVLLGIDRMIRHIGQGFVIGHQSIPWEKFSRSDLELNLSHIAGILVKPTWINIVGSPYVGPLGVAGVVLSLLMFRQLNSIQRFMMGVIGFIGLYGLLSAFGTHLGLAYLNYYLPFINQSREPCRHLVFFLFGVVFLTGLGFDQIGKCMNSPAKTPQQERRIWLSIVTLSVVGFGILVWELWTNSPLKEGGWLVLFLAPIIALVGLIFRIRTTAPIALAALIASAASAISPTRTFDLTVSDYIAPAYLRSLEVLAAVRSKIDATDFRIDFKDQQLNPVIWGMNGSYFGFNSFYNRMTPQPFDQFRFSRRSETPLRAMMGARYVLCNSQEHPTDSNARELFEVQGYKLFENSTYLSRLTLIHARAGTIKNEAEFISEADRGFDFLTSAYIQDSDTVRLKDFLPAASDATNVNDDKLDVTESSPNRVAATIESSQPGVVVLNEWFIPAWKAKVNDKPAKTVSVNQWQVGVPLQAGRNVIEFTYRPSVFCWLLILNRITWLLLTALTALGVIRLYRESARLKLQEQPAARG